MNSLEGILALSALLLGFGIILGAVNAQNEKMISAEEGIQAKIITLNCGAIIDSFASNNAEEYLQNIECEIEKNIVKFTIGGKTKQTQTIVETEKNYGLKIKKTEHYLTEE